MSPDVADTEGTRSPAAASSLRFPFPPCPAQTCGEHFRDQGFLSSTFALEKKGPANLQAVSKTTFYVSLCSDEMDFTAVPGARRAVWGEGVGTEPAAHPELPVAEGCLLTGGLVCSGRGMAPNRNARQDGPSSAAKGAEWTARGMGLRGQDMPGTWRGWSADTGWWAPVLLLTSLNRIRFQPPEQPAVRELGRIHHHLPVPQGLESGPADGGRGLHPPLASMSPEERSE